MEISSTLARGVAHAAMSKLPVIDLGDAPLSSLYTAGKSQLESALPDYLNQQRWFAGKGKAISSLRLSDTIAVPSADKSGPAGHLAMIDVRYADGGGEMYAHPVVATATDGSVDPASLLAPLASVHAADGTFMLSDGATSKPFVQGLVDVMQGARAVTTNTGELQGHGSEALTQAASGRAQLTVSPLSLTTSNTSVKLTDADDRATALKIIRRHDTELPANTPSQALDVWKGDYLSNQAGFRNTPQILGAADYTGADQRPRTLAVLSDFVPNDGDGWHDALSSLHAAITAPSAEAADTAITSYANMARTQGQRLGEFHRALANGGPSSEFRGVAPDNNQLAAATAALHDRATKTFSALRSANGKLASIDSAALDTQEQQVHASIDQLTADLRSAPPVEQIHIHGDFHLGQLLRTGDDVQIIDLEGAPSLPIDQRWQRANAMEDVAQQHSSYDYAAATGAHDDGATPGAAATAARWADRATAAFTDGWRAATSQQSFVPRDQQFGASLRLAGISNALAETQYEIGSRPDWAHIPFDRLTTLTKPEAPAAV